MVRINLIDPHKLADQHLIAEYNEILMLFGYVSKHPKPKGIPQNYRLGPGHIKFFKDKLLYLKDRHEEIAEEMKSRGFNPKVKVDLSPYDIALLNNWSPNAHDIEIIQKRLLDKIFEKVDFYRYYGEKKKPEFFEKLITAGTANESEIKANQRRQEYGSSLNS